MIMKKVVDVITIEAKEKAQNCLILDNISKFMYSIGGGYLTQSYLKDACKTAYHVYFLSDEEIKVGDWYLNMFDNTVNFASETFINGIKTNCKKIIATTDISLEIEESYKVRSRKNVEHCVTVYNLPQPSIEFLTQFAVNYNSKTPITQVEVKYEDNGYEVDMEGRGGSDTCWFEKIELKVNPINNTVITSIIKNNYTKAEVIEIYKQGAKDYCSSPQSIESFFSETGDGTKWIKQNL